MFTPGRAALLLLIVTAWLYAPTLGYGFVYEDGHDLDAVTRPLSASLPIWAWKPARSLTQVSMRLTYDVFGLWPGAYHAGNLALHLLNGGVFYGLAASCLGSWAAVIAVGVFLLHPVQVEAVAYVSNRPDLLATTALLLGWRAVIAERWWLVGLMGLVAFLAKETAIVVLPLLALVAYWRGARVPSWAVLACVPVTVALGAFLLLSYPLAFDLRNALTQLTAFAWLLSRIVVPVGLTIDPDWNWITPMWMSAAAGASAWLLVLAVRHRQACGALLVGASVLVILPRMGVSLVEGLHFHHLYLLMPVVCLCLGALASAESDRHGISASLA